MTGIEQDAAGGRARATRDLLYEAAAVLFVQRGYAETTMADIAEQAGTSRRTAFNHFPAKSDIPMLWTRQMADQALEVISGSSGPGIPQRIRAYFRQISQLVEAEPELSRQMMLGWTTAAGPIRYESQLLTDLTPLLADGRARGEIGRDVDLDAAARTLSDTYMGVVFRWVRDPDPGDGLQDSAGAGIDLVLSAVRSQRRAREGQE